MFSISTENGSNQYDSKQANNSRKKKTIRKKKDNFAESKHSINQESKSNKNYIPLKRSF